MIDDTEFQQSLVTKGIGSRYINEVKDLRRKLRKDFKREDSKLIGDLRDELEQSKLHDQLISMAIFPFLEKSSVLRKLGYEFVKCAPLLEKGVKNLDYLIYKRSGKRAIAIFGEGKTRTSHPLQIINEYNDRKKIVEQNRNYILENYLDKSKETIFEYVLTVFSGDAVKMHDAIEQQGGELI
ncbi:MAG: hypothetical protein KGL95_07975, partial [Patescibacteria group bacterium]|nr:hypothetical protein [Patescibacteria group bacterium]